MNYQYTSIDEVIGRVLRNTRLTDTGVISDLPIWIGDAMELLQTSSILEDVTEELCVKFFQARMPKGLVELSAVTLNGKRLLLDTSSLYQISRRTKSGIPEAFQQNYKIVDPFAEREHPIDIRIAAGEPELTKYYLKPGYVCLTKIKDTKIELHYNRHACDENGLPMIPDNGNYKEALYWFVRGKLIGAGILEETRSVNELSCEFQFEKFAGRAINEITYPSVDKMERVRRNQVNFDLPEHYWANFNQV